MKLIKGRFTKFKFGLFKENGSISVIVIGLFVITIAALMIMTNIAFLVEAKRSLAQATEAAAQRGVHTLDKSLYYRGKANLLTAPLALIKNRAHPVIPIDCARGTTEVLLELNSWSGITGPQLQSIQLIDFECDGHSLAIKTQSQVDLPFTIPFSSIDSVALTASAGTANMVQEGFYLFGIRLY